ncbi:MAG: O-antigen ligase family protein [Planctomycetota bacterium]
MIRWTHLLLLFAAVLAFDPVSFDDHAVKALVIGVVAAGLFFLSPVAKPRLAWTDVSLAVCVFVAVRGAMLLRGPLPAESWRAWIVLGALALVFHIAAGTIEKRWLLDKAPKALALLGGLLAAIALVQLVTGARQASATFAMRNFAGAGLAMLLPFFGAWRRGRFLLLALVAAGLLATQSRGGILAGGCAMALYATWNRPRWRWLALAATAVIVIAAGLFLKDSNTVKVRLTWYDAAVTMGTEDPLLGKGAGGFAREYPARRTLEEIQISGGRRVHATHNDYLESFAEGGLLGITALLFLAFAALRAARRHRAAAAATLAFFIHALVDLPLHDPSLLALLFFVMLLPAEVCSRVSLPRLAPIAVGGVLVVACSPLHAHWRASRAFGRYLDDGDRNELDVALGFEKTHAGALMARGQRDDLELLLEQRPHDPNVLYQLGRFIEESEGKDAAIAHYRRVAKDYHHALSRIRLAQLAGDDDPLQALSLLRTARDINPRDPTPVLHLARLKRKSGQLAEARKLLAEAAKLLKKDDRPDKLDPRLILEERFAIVLASMGESHWSRTELQYVVPRIAPSVVRREITAALERGARIRGSMSAPRLEIQPGETPLEFAARLDRAKDSHRAHVLEATRPAFTTAYYLAAVLLDSTADAPLMREAARAAHGLGEHPSGHRWRSIASFLRGLEALARGDEDTANRRFDSAQKGYAEWANDGYVHNLIRSFLHKHPAQRELLKRFQAR